MCTSSFWVIKTNILRLIVLKNVVTKILNRFNININICGFYS